MRLIDRLLGRELVQPDLTPGAWYCYYMADYLTEFYEEKSVSSTMVELADGEFIWATATPEWDRDWFEKRGLAFPQRWMPWDRLANYGLEMKDLRG